MAAPIVMIRGAIKLTLGHEVFLVDSLEGAPKRWYVRCQVRCPSLTFGSTLHSVSKMSALNQASLLPDNDPEDPLQDCPEVTDLIQSIRLVMTDFLLMPNEVLFTDGSSLSKTGLGMQGQRW